MIDVEDAPVLEDISPAPEEDETDRQFAATLARGLEVLRCFTADEPILGNKEIAARTGLPKATVSRMTYTLTCLGYLRPLPWAGKYGKYDLGPAVLAIGYPLLANLDIRQKAAPAMRALAEHAGGWVTLGMRERLNMVYVETLRSPLLSKAQVAIGQTFPIVQSAMGRAYLAALFPGERESLINQAKVKTPALWKKCADDVEKAIYDYRTRGFCLHRGAFNPHVHTVAVPMRKVRNREPLVFNCVIPASTSRPGQLEDDLGPRLVQMVRHIEDAVVA